MNLKDFIGGLISSPADNPTAFPVQPESQAKQKQFSTPFKEYEHYFVVEINEMFLSEKVKWFREYTPVVYTTTCFQYGKTTVETPFVVGPTLLQAQMKDLAKDLLLRNTTIAGWHPYAGGTITLTILLCKAVADDYINRTFRAIEKISGVFGPASIAAMGSAINMSRVIVEGVNELVDSKGIEGIALFRKDFDPNKSEGFYPGYYLLLDKMIGEEEQKNFIVRDDQLFYIENGKTVPYRQTNYVLFSIQQHEARTDYEKFPFFQYFERAEEMAARKPLSDAKIQEIQDQLSALYIAMLQSPDLTESHANLLMDSFVSKVQKIKDRNFTLKEAVRMSEDAKNGYTREMSNRIRAI